MKKVAFFDLDKTIYNTYSFFPLIEFEVEKGRVAKSSWEDVQKTFQQYKNGELTYAATGDKLLTILAGSLKGQRYEDLYEDSLEFFLHNKQNFYSYFENILPKLKESHDVYIITTSTNYVAAAIVNIFQLKDYIASEFEVTEGKFTGNVRRTLSEDKGVVAQLIATYGKAGSIAVGDSENDVGMLELVEYPLCINPNQELKKVANERGWRTFEAGTAEEIFNSII